MYIKSADGILEGLLAPVTSSGEAFCDLCGGKLTDYEELVEVGPTWCKVLVRHHGQEQVHRFDFESVEWDERDLRSRMRGRRWFQPHEV